MNAAAGTYIMVLQSFHSAYMNAGRLGRLEVIPGYYLYVGSAFGPGGVAARVKHHRRLSPRPHWHVDHLRALCEFVDVRCVYNERLEHDWARQLGNMQAVRPPFAGFGSSDCGCDTHLFFTERKPGAKLWRDLFQELPAVC